MRFRCHTFRLGDRRCHWYRRTRRGRRLWPLQVEMGYAMHIYIIIYIYIYIHTIHVYNTSTYMLCYACYISVAYGICTMRLIYAIYTVYILYIYICCMRYFGSVYATDAGALTLHCRRGLSVEVMRKPVEMAKIVSI